ncbi:hypothetical protein FYK55_28400 [Roseiconus nitratireducens]|uniref:Resolvase n=1 Tax=Roseiconus nitratireducens TaxID=2605748 RepID=A0A5M6CRC9_9BACT|nr:hypothetical protein [Roseiconus nitratireducens]KAA5535675.1 hypothetical protein FYK55_28400 [Roseiconus nitratireducens]
MGRLAGEDTDDGRLADVQERIQMAEARMKEIDREMDALRDPVVDDAKVLESLTQFDGVWAALPPRDQARIVELLIERIVYDGRGGDLSITYLPTGVRSLADEFTSETEEAA